MRDWLLGALREAARAVTSLAYLGELHPKPGCQCCLAAVGKVKRDGSCFSMVSMDFHSFPTIFWCKTWRMMLCHYSGGKSWFGVWQMMASLSFYGYVTSYRWDEIRAGLTIFR